MVPDCLLVGYNDSIFTDSLQIVRAMGKGSGAYRDLNLAFVEMEGRPYRCMDLLNHFRGATSPPACKKFDNSDFISSVILYLRSFLHRRGFNVDYVNLVHRDKDQFAAKLETDSPRAVAITTTFYVSPYPVREIVSFIRSRGFKGPIIIGGPYISNQAKLYDQNDLATLFDFVGGDIYINSSEGEATLARVLGALQNDTDLREIPNLAIRRLRNFDFTPAEQERNELADEPVNYALFGPDAIGQFVSLRTAKSCPFACAFCGFPQRAGKYTYVDVAEVGRHLDSIAALGSVTTLTFIDDTFNVPKGRFRDILRLMIERDYRFRWNCFYRSDCGDDATIELMAEAGCEGVFLGVESGSDAMLKKMNKTARRADYVDAIRKFRTVSISTYVSLLVGFPGETLDTIQQTVDLLETTAPNYYRANLLYLDPITSVWKNREALGLTGEGFSWKHPTMDSSLASEIIDWMFASVRNSTWLPQHGFEQWALFYLQRHGFSEQRVNSFVRGFNAAIKEKLLLNRTELSAELTSVLRQIATGAPMEQIDLAPITAVERLRTMSLKDNFGATRQAVA
jgi:anaerobic magnesium-protoporphyrin IX monomethyl ester cyclase